jgi:hypothetical protein
MDLALGVKRLNNEITRYPYHSYYVLLKVDSNSRMYTKEYRFLNEFRQNFANELEANPVMYVWKRKNFPELGIKVVILLKREDFFAN